MNLQNTRCVWCLELLSHFTDGRTEVVSLAPGLRLGRAKQGPLDSPPASAPAQEMAPSAGEPAAPPLKVA